MKILFIAPLPPPITGNSLAVKVFLDEIIKHHQIEIVNLSKLGFQHGINSLHRVRSVLGILRDLMRKREGVDLIYFTISQSKAGNLKDLLIYLLCFRNLSRMVIHLHGGDGMRKIMSNKSSLSYKINKYFIKRLGGVIVLGKTHVDIFSDLIPKEKIHIVHNFAEDYLFLKEEEIKLKFENTKPIRMLFLSNLIPGKGYNELVEAYSRLDESLKENIIIDFAGGFESESQEVEFLKKIKEIKQLNYHGIVDGPKKQELFRNAHVFCLPTYYLYEGQPISILEAYASGCVVLTTNHSGIKDIFKDKINGSEVQKKSADSIKLAIEEILGNTEKLLPIALLNRKTANDKYRTSIYNDALGRVIDGVRQDKYQICSNCIMDTSDTNITFDERGWCDYCVNYYKNILPYWHPNEIGMRELQPMIDKIKREGKGKDHDCIIGLSGGVDSSYVAYLAKEKFGLRPLLFHVDAGWNSQEAVNNIQRLVDGLGLELYTEVINWEEMKDLQLAFFKAQVPHIDTPQDHVFFAALYNFAAKNNTKYVLTGANYSTECVREPLEWHYHASDLRQIKDIHKRFGNRPLTSFPMADIFKYKLYYRFVKGVRIVKPLNHVRYYKEEAMQELVDRFGWQKYAYKHYESRFTRFYEGFWLPKKFGYDKHRAHFSSLILTKQMTRDEALEKIAQPAYDEETIKQDFEYIAKKLGLSVNELQKIMEGENKTYRDYKNNMWLINLGTKVLKYLGIQRAIIR